MTHFTLFFRKLQREKIFSVINILGLSLGIACSLMIYQYVKSEISHDQFHINRDRIFRINQTFIWGDDTRQLFSSTGPGVSLALKEEIPEIDKVTRVHTPGNFLVTYKDQNRIISNDESNIFAADSNFLEVFSFSLKLGDPSTALYKPHSILLTQETANKYFGNEVPIGRQIQLGRSGESVNYEVTGVFDELPTNSYIEFDILLSMSSFPRVERQSWSWIWTTFETFVLLNTNANIDNVAAKLDAIPAKHAEATLQRVMGITFEDYVKGGKEWKLYLQPFSDIHLGSSNIFNRLNTVGNRKIVNGLTAAAIFILLLSCINYMNLKTSQITRNVKETGIRKLLGSGKVQIGVRYFVESLLFMICSIAVGILLAYYMTPFFNQISGKEIHPNVFFTPGLIFALIILAVILSILTGGYPALLLSAISPIDVVRGKLKSGRESQILRNGFVILQFSISIMLIASTVVVYQQLRYSFNKDIGFQKENLIAINRVEWLDSRKSFAEELRNIPGVIQTSLNTSMPPRVFNGDQFLAEGDQNKSIPLNYTQVDENFLPTLGIVLLHGRNFSTIEEQEKHKVIINESAVEILGWEVSDEVLGRKIIYPGGNDPFEIIGIAKDFNYWSLQAAIEPLALFHINNPVMGFYGNMFVAVRVENSGFGETLNQIRQQWESRDPGVAFSYEFTDDAFASGFQSTEQFGKSLGIFAGLALFIACLGLLGMIIYVVEQRTREIGIRKVLGSNSMQVVVLISKRFVSLVAISLVLSIPVTVWVMNMWLEDFQYRITISPWIFVVSGLISIIFALGIVGVQSFKAAIMNPATTLRDE